MAPGENASHEFKHFQLAFFLIVSVCLIPFIFVIRDCNNKRDLILQDLRIAQQDACELRREVKKLSEECIRCNCTAKLQSERLNSGHPEAETQAESAPDVHDFKSQKEEKPVVDEKSILDEGSYEREDKQSDNASEANEQEEKQQPTKESGYHGIIANLFDYTLAVVMAIALLRYLLREYLHF